MHTTWLLHGLHPLGNSSHTFKDFLNNEDWLYKKNKYICSYEHFHNKKDTNLLWHKVVTQKNYSKA
jgi:hypothetical protein